MLVLGLRVVFKHVCDVNPLVCSERGVVLGPNVKGFVGAHLHANANAITISEFQQSFALGPGNACSERRSNLGHDAIVAKHPRRGGALLRIRPAGKHAEEEGSEDESEAEEEEPEEVPEEEDEANANHCHDSKG